MATKYTREQTMAIVQLAGAALALVLFVVGVIAFIMHVQHRQAQWRINTEKYLIANSCKRVGFTTPNIFETRETIYECKQGLMLSSEIGQLASP